MNDDLLNGAPASARDDEGVRQRASTWVSEEDMPKNFHFLKEGLISDEDGPRPPLRGWRRHLLKWKVRWRVVRFVQAVPALRRQNDRSMFFALKTLSETGRVVQEYRVSDVVLKQARLLKTALRELRKLEVLHQDVTAVERALRRKRRYLLAAAMDCYFEAEMAKKEALRREVPLSNASPMVAALQI